MKVSRKSNYNISKEKMYGLQKIRINNVKMLKKIRN